MNTCHVLGENGFDAEKAGATGGMLAARSMAIIAPADDERAGLLMPHCPLIIRRIDAAEDEFADAMA